jgi:hypothetical protein
MKKKAASRSAFFKLRLILALLLCVVGALFAFAALATQSDRILDATASHGWFARLASVFDVAGESPQRQNKERRGATSMASTNSTGSAAVNVPAQTQLDPAIASKIAQHSNALGETVYSISASGFDISPPLSKLAKLPPTVPETVGARPELPFPSWRIPHSDQPDPVTQVAPSSARSKIGPAPAAPSTGFNFLGQIGGSSFPPDTNGSVGNDQYVETVNTTYQVWTLNRVNSTVTSLAGPSSINTLWSGFVGGNCSTRNDGDPVVLYDKVANRWLISQFTSATSGGSYFQCVAISTSANAGGTYFRYAFAVPNGNFGDYPKFGAWTDAYYMMAHAFTTSASTGSYVGGLFAAMDRTKMLAGDSSATWQVIIDSTEGGHMPADLDGFAPPPGGAPGIFVSIHSSGMYLYRMKVDFTTPANTTRTLQAVMPTAPAAAACGGGACIPQPGSSVVIDSLADRLMFRLAYRNFIDHESLVISHSVDPGITGVVSGVRWYDFRISGQPDAVCSSYPCTYQQGTVADVANGRSRWMPSISMDGAENILVGYSASGLTNGTDNHSIRYTGRAKTDPLGTMTGPETIIFTGTRNIVNTMTNPERWGDYTSVSIDPADDCTFWHANEYYLSGGSTGSGNANWKTRIASARFPAGTGAGQCPSTTCTSRPVSAPTIGTASVSGANQITVTWSGISPTPGSYAIERAIGAAGSEGLYQPLASVLGTSNSFTDTTVQGGLTYTYRVTAATDSAGKCQALVRSGRASATATGACNLKPTFAGATSASSNNNSSCGITINWSPATSSCPLTPNMRYNIFRGTTPNFVPGVANRIATCAPGPSSYVDTNNLTSGTTYYYIVRAEDDSTGNGGECGGGNEESNSVVVAGTPYGSGLQGSTGTWSDGGGDVTAFLQLNVGNSGDPVWRFVNTTDDSGANHTPSGAYAYRNAGPTASAHYSDNSCALAQTPVLTVGASTVNLTYWERHQMEYNWDGVAVEFSRNGGAWTTVPTPSNATGNGCLSTDVTTDWSTLSCTGSPPVNACGYVTTTPVITGPLGSGTACASWVTSASPSAYGRRCHLLTGLSSGDTIQFRWRSTSDPSADYAGFYLDDIAVTNVFLPNSCAAALNPTSLAAASATGTYGGTVNLSATLTSGGNGVSGKSVSFTLNGSSVGSATTNASGVASLSNVSLSGINVGTYPTGVGASFAGGSGYASSSGTNSLTVNKADQTITFTLNSSYAKSAGTVALNGAATSGLAVTYGSSNTNVATVSGSTMTLVAPGSVTITASQAGNSNYNAAPSVPQSTVITGPIAANDTVSRSAGSTGMKIAASTLLANDSRIVSDGSTQTDSLMITGVTSGTGNTVTLSGSTILYKPSNASASDPLTFTYTVSDGTSTATGTVTVNTISTPFTITPVNQTSAVYDSNTDTTSITLEFVTTANQMLNIDYSSPNTNWTAYAHNPVNTGATGDFVITITASGDFSAEWNSGMFFRATRL